jgi:hypothetical protein
MTSLLRQDPVLLVPEPVKQALGAVQGCVNLDAVEADRNRLAIGSGDAGNAVWQALNLALWLESRNLHVV